MAGFVAKWQVMRPLLMILFNFVLAFMFAKAERGLRLETLRGGFSDADTQIEIGFLDKAFNFLWQSDGSGYTHVWPVSFHFDLLFSVDDVLVMKISSSGCDFCVFRI